MMTKIVHPEGSLDAKYCIIGEAPGGDEERTGRPFVGRAGALLDRLMWSVGIARSECYITNVVKERPPSNNIEHFIKFTAKGPIPTSSYRMYEQELYKELEKSKANVFVPLGNVPLYALTRLTAITKRRGSILEGMIGDRKIKVIPTIHPAAALRQYDYVYPIRQDFIRIKEEATYPEVRLPVRNLTLEPSFMDVMAYLDKVESVGVTGEDIEVMREEVSCISFAVSPEDAICIPFFDSVSNTHYFNPHQEMEIWKRIGRINANEAIRKIGQNFIFDITFLFHKLGIVTRGYDDTMIAMNIAHPAFPKGLDFITSIYTKEPYYKDEGKKWMKPGNVASDSLGFWRYNALDSAVCVEALPKILKDVERQGNMPTYDAAISLIEPLVYMQERGERVDVEGLRKASEEADTTLAELHTQLNELCGRELNPASPKQLKEYFYIEKKARPYVNRTTGNITVDEKALKRLSRLGHKEAKVLLEIRQVSKLKSSYLDVSLDERDRLVCAYNPGGTKSGRLSSGKNIFGVGMNKQTMPEQFRPYVIADDGMLKFNMDLEQAENRIFAHLAFEEAMMQAFANGVDVHRLTASLIFGKHIDEISDEPGSCAIGGGLFSERFWGKKANHSLNYDLGYKTFALYYEITESEAKFIVEKFHHSYPRIRQFHAWIRAKIQENRTLTNLMGRNRIFTGRMEDSLFKEAYSWIPQSTVADIINRRGVNYIYYNQDSFRDIDLNNQVHDSIVFQMSYRTCSFEKQAENVLRIKESLEQPLQWKGLEFVVPVSLEVGLNLSKKSLQKVKLNEYSTARGLGRRLHDIYDELRTGGAI